MTYAKAVAALLALAAAGAVAAQPAEEGKKIYESACVTCHGANGKGALPGVPDFTKKGGVLSQPDALLLKRVTEGFQSPGSPMPMPPKGGNASLTDAQLRASIQYIRQAFGAQ